MSSTTVARSGVYANATHEQVAGTLRLLRWFDAFAASGCNEAPDPFGDRGWRLKREHAPGVLRGLIHAAINRRAGWVDDPSCWRGTARPNHHGKFPRKAGGNYYVHLRLIAQEINTPRLIMWPECLGEHRWLLARLPNRFAVED